MTDSFDQLRHLSEVASRPDPTFVRDLSARLLRAATPLIDPSPQQRGQQMPQSITPYLCVADGAAAIEWYRSHFGAMVSNVFSDNGRIGHAELEFGGNVFYLADEYPEIGVVAPPTMGAGSSASFVALVADADASIERAVAGGAVLERPITNAHGSRNGWVKDPFGHRWNISTPQRTDAPSLRRPAEPYYLTITSADVERAAAFFGRVLDWQFAEYNNGGRHIRNTTMPMGLRPPHTPFDETAPGEIQLWFIVRDFDDAVDRVRTAGGTVSSITGYDSGREARCEDDQGALFRLSEPAPGYDPS
jgi:uncharacterized glyoxalase superfamily protein PhnB/catechol 2,3-dioxygenase-like lactoylglutathione lyase family enzyme